MACTISSFCSSTQVLCRKKLSHNPKMRSQAFSDKGNALALFTSTSTKKIHSFFIHTTLHYSNDVIGKPANIVDANLSVLRERIQQVRKRERLRNTRGWNYVHKYDQKYKRDAMLSEFLEIMGSACGAVVLVFLYGSLFIYLVSFLVYL